MRIRQLEAFRSTILHGTMSAAAARLRTSQPTVSRLLSELEYSLGFPLFTRRKGRVVPTSEGMEFYQRLDEMFGAFVKLQSAADDIRRDRNKALKIISLPALSMTVIPEIIERFAQKRADISVTLMTVDVPTYFNMIREADTDIAFGNQLGNQPMIEQITLAEVDYVCAIPPGHRLVGNKFIDVSDLDGESIISLSEMNHDIFRLHEDLLDSRKGKISRRFITQNSANAYALVLRGLGIAILEPFSATIWNRNGVVTKPFRPRLAYKYSASFNKNAVRSDTISMLMKIAKEAFANYKTPG